MRKIGRFFKKMFSSIGLFFTGVVREGKKVRWPNKKSMYENTSTVLVFCVFFGLFFSASYVIAQSILKAIEYM